MIVSFARDFGDLFTFIIDRTLLVWLPLTRLVMFLTDRGRPTLGRSQMPESTVLDIYAYIVVAPSSLIRTGCVGNM